MGNNRKDGQADGHSIQAGIINPPNQILADVHVDTDDGGAILVKLATGEGGGGGGGEVAGDSAELSGSVDETFSTKRFAAFEWLPSATGSGNITIDGVVYPPFAALPTFPDVGASRFHRDIVVSGTGIVGLIVHYLNSDVS